MKIETEKVKAVKTWSVPLNVKGLPYFWSSSLDLPLWRSPSAKSGGIKYHFDGHKNELCLNKEWIKKMRSKLPKKARALQGIWNLFEGGDIGMGHFVPDIYICSVRLGREKKGFVKGNRSWCLVFV